MLKVFLAFGLLCAFGTGEPVVRRGHSSTKVPQPPAAPPPPPAMPMAADCWRDFFVNIGACQHDFEGTDRIVVAQRRAALSGAGNGFNSCLNIVPQGSPVTETPEAPPGGVARPWTCLEQLTLDIKECRTKFSPGVSTLQGDPDRDTMKNAFDQCINGAVSKNGWCNGRKPNNPVALPVLPSAPRTQIDILEGPTLAASKESVTMTVTHSGDGEGTGGADAVGPMNITWYAAVFSEDGEVVSRQELGTTMNVPPTPTQITLPLAGVGAEGVEVVVLARRAHGAGAPARFEGAVARAN